MPILLERPKLVIDENGRPISENEMKKRQWKTTVVCGQHSLGCGAKSEIVFNDIFKKVIQNPSMTQIGYHAKCMHCHQDLVIPHNDTPWHYDKIPVKTKWLKTYMTSLVDTLHAESNDRQRLKIDLMKDNIDIKYLREYDWS